MGGFRGLINRPILWSENGQITGDTIMLISNVETKQLDSLRVFDNSIMVQKDTIDGFNQIKGKQLYGLFEDNKITEVNFIKNAESLYYMRNDQGELVGIDKTVAATITLILKDQEIEDITYFKDPDGKTYPESELPPNARILKNMEWRGDERMNSKADLLKNRPKYDMPIIRGLEDLSKTDTLDNSFYKQKDLNKKSSLILTDSISKKAKPQLKSVPLKVSKKVKQKNNDKGF